MPDLTPAQPRLIGHMRDVTGRSLAVSADRDTVILRWAGQSIRLGPAERAVFIRLFMLAKGEAAAAAAAEQADADPDDAGIWCGLDGGCQQGPPGTHLFGPSCHTEAEAACDE